MSEADVVRLAAPAAVILLTAWTALRTAARAPSSAPEAPSSAPERAKERPGQEDRSNPTSGTAPAPAGAPAEGPSPMVPARPRILTGEPAPPERLLPLPHRLARLLGGIALVAALGAAAFVGLVHGLVLLLRQLGP